MTPSSRLLFAAAGCVALAAAPGKMVQPAPVKPWVAHAEVDCDWWLSGPNGKQLHASIGRGDDDPVLTVSERAFLPFAEDETVPLVLRFSRDPRREAKAEAWVSSVVGAIEQGGGKRMLGMYLRPDARRAMGGADWIEVLHEGKLLTAIPLSQTPSEAALDACVTVRGPNSEEESG